MTRQTLNIIETAINCDESLTPELTKLILQMFSGDTPRRMRSRKVAEILNVCMETMRRWRSNGTLEAVGSVGGAYRYHPADVLALAISREV